MEHERQIYSVSDLERYASGDVFALMPGDRPGLPGAFWPHIYGHRLFSGTGTETGYIVQRLAPEMVRAVRFKLQYIPRPSDGRLRVRVTLTIPGHGFYNPLRGNPREIARALPPIR